MIDEAKKQQLKDYLESENAFYYSDERGFDERQLCVEEYIYRRFKGYENSWGDYVLFNEDDLDEINQLRSYAAELGFANAVPIPLKFSSLDLADDEMPF